MSSAMLKDNYLIELALNGNQQAYNQLITRYYRKIRLLIYNYVSEQATTHDLTQDVFFKVYQYLDHFKQDCQFSTWVYRITLNTIKNHFRNLAVRSECALDDIEQLPVDIINPESLIIGMELGQQVELAYDNLPMELQDCYCMYQFDGLSYLAISLQLECPIGTVRSRIFRARQLLRAAI